jgi:hypothetical protein
MHPLKMPPLKVTVAGLLCLVWLQFMVACSQLPISPTAAHWYVGTFSGQLIGSNERRLVTVTCPSPTVCEYSIGSQEAHARPATRVRSERIETIDPTIPNNNLNHTRITVQSHPDLYRGRDGQPLEALRPLLESTAKYERCVGASEFESTWGRLCKLDSEADTLPAALLLLPTMKPTCARQAFCAYYVIPLRRN